MLQQDLQEVQVQAVADMIRQAFVDPDATDEIDRAAPAMSGGEVEDDVDVEC